MATTVIAVANASGSVGKTTTTLSLAALTASAGRKVCVVDFDPQGNATVGAGCDTLQSGVPQALAAAAATKPIEQPNEMRTTLVRGMTQRSPAGFDVLGSGTYAELQHTEDTADEAHSIPLLRAALTCLDHDVVLIDCHVGLGRFPRIALAAADTVLTVVEPARKEASGVAQLLNALDDLGGREKLRGILLNRVQPRQRVSKEYVPALREAWGDLVSPPIRDAAAVKQAYEVGEPVTVAYPREPVSDDLRAAHTWLTDRGVL